jgi:tetraacyldisaccharide 4'-kinase
MQRIPPALAPVIYIPSLAYETLVRMRALLYAKALLPKNRLPAPVISIGNITMGGSGKTPLVIYVARTLAKLGFDPAVLSRGYRRQYSNELRIIPPGETIPSPALMLGDEPALVRRHIASLWMGISKNRFLAGSKIAKLNTRIAFVLDDGFQHQKLHRDLDIVIVDRTQPLRTNRVFPRGTLREPLSGLRRCHMVVISGVSAGKPDLMEEEIQSLHRNASIFHCIQSIQTLIPFSSWKDSLTSPDSRSAVKSAYLAAALGNPGRFCDDVRRLDIEVRGCGFFRDHHWLQKKDWLACTEDARSKGADAIITTEKDAVKISQPPDFPLLVAVQATEMSDARAFELVLTKYIRERV